jgi:uncharacterized delta-60 repeat protein
MKLFSAKRLFGKLPVVCLILLGILSVSAAGDVDTSFNAALINIPADKATVSIIQPDNKIIVYGNFESVNGVATNTLVRLNADGTLDTTFNAPRIDPTVTSSGPGVRALALQSNGKILIGGVFTIVGGSAAYALIRLNPNGSRDLSFAFPSASTGIRDVEDIKVLPDDSILLAAGGILKLLPDGSSDPSFTLCGNSAARRVRTQPDGKIIWASFDLIKRCSADGAADNGFQTVSTQFGLYDIDVQADGKIIFGGIFANVNGFALARLGRANADGTIDASFTSNATPTSGITKVLVLPDTKVLINGNVAGSSNNGINRLNADGTLDSSFIAANTNNSINDLDVQSDGKIIRSSTSFGMLTQIVARLNTDGSTDNPFQPNFGRHGTGYAVFVQPDGKILAGGDFAFANNTQKSGFARFNSDGSVDTGFNTDFAIAAGESIRAIDIQPDGKIIVGISSATVDSRRLNADGSTDVVFPNTKSTRDVKVLSSGKILVAGGGYLRQYNSDGSLDGSFNVTVANTVNSIAVQADGKIIIGGNFTQINSTARGYLARLNADGTLDASFTAAANFNVHDVALQTDGRILIGGEFTGVNFTTRAFLARLNSDGTLDTGYVPVVPSTVYRLRLQPDNKAFISGMFNTVNSLPRQKLARLNLDGSTDTSFNVPGGIDDTVWSIDLQADGKIVIGGAFSKVDDVPKLGIARLLTTSAPERTLFDYDGDGKADISVFRPSENKWYILQSSDSQVVQTVFAVAGDIPVPSDYDGDGKTDIAVFRPSTGDWLYRASFSGAQVQIHFGQSGDIPRPSDFDGDGRVDFVVYRPSNSVWYRVSAVTGQVSIIAFGIAEDKPLVGDFDGDGKSDLAVFRPSTGDWWYASTVLGGQFAVVHWGQTGDIPVPGDYDADGKTDFVVYRPSNGGWYILRSGEQNYTILQFGIAEDKPVAADFDGDGKADVAVWRPSTGTWYLLQTTAGFGGVQWGTGGDVPTENAFVP